MKRKASLSLSQVSSSFKASLPGLRARAPSTCPQVRQAPEQVEGRRQSGSFSPQRRLSDFP
jgi:hypothetical protein